MKERATTRSRATDHPAPSSGLKCAASNSNEPSTTRKTDSPMHQVAEEKERSLDEVRARHEALVRQFCELRDWTEESEQALLKAKLEIEILEQRCKDSFNAGRSAGRLEMEASDEYRAAIRRAALSGIKEYLRSSTFEMLWAEKAAEHEAIGFMRCRSRVLELGGFKEGFDIGLLDGNLDPPVDDDV